MAVLRSLLAKQHSATLFILPSIKIVLLLVTQIDQRPTKSGNGWEECIHCN